jgi:LPXTG-motif cell wall-anchored protein
VGADTSNASSTASTAPRKLAHTGAQPLLLILFGLGMAGGALLIRRRLRDRPRS